MGEVINLRGARKARKRADATASADANRARFGRSKAEKQIDAAEAARREKLLDGAQLTAGDLTDST
ncbi:hypothetical protein BH10PSE14_BH10PSE14_14590 [soil metagenome]